MQNRPNVEPHRRAAAAAAALLLAAVCLVAVAPPVQAQTVPTMTASPTSGLDPDGTAVTVTGSGYDEQKGIYVAVCVIPPEGQLPSPCLGGIDTSGESGSSKWISSNPPAYGERLSQPYEPGGSFNVEILVQARDEFTDCTSTPCAVVTRNDHTRSGDRSQDVIVPISFAEPADAPPPIPGPLPSDPPADEPPAEEPPAEEPPADEPPADAPPPVPGPLPPDPPADEPPAEEPAPTPPTDDPPGGEPPEPGTGGWNVTRTAGPDRFATAAALSAQSHPFGAPLVYVATGAAFPDALAGGSAAAVAGAPVLLVTADDVPDPTRAELERLAPERIVVLGGPAAVGDAVLADLGLVVADVTRLAGPDRFATAAAVSAATWTDGAATAFVATGADYPDALTGAAAAGASDAPVLLTGRDALPDATRAELARLAPERVVVLGGASAVGDAVVADLGRTAEVTRVAGDNRFATAAQVAALLPAAEAAFVATGANYPDALAASAVAGRDGAPILLVTTDDVPDETMAALTALDPAGITVLGGEQAVTDQVMGQLQGTPSA